MKNEQYKQKSAFFRKRIFVCDAITKSIRTIIFFEIDPCFKVSG